MSERLLLFLFLNVGLLFTMISIIVTSRCGDLRRLGMEGCISSKCCRLIGHGVTRAGLRRLIANVAYRKSAG